ncbi:MAG: proton-conducting transporter membrane subunit [Gammaproteobacteria bacterium]
MLPALQTIPWAIVLILLPLVAGMLCFLWPRLAPTLGMATASINVLAVAALAWQLHFRFHGSYRHAVGGWGAPLGIDLYADGLSLLLLLATALVGLGVSLYAVGYFRPEQARRFWPIWLLLLGALHALFFAADIFNLYVTLELVGLAAVALASLNGDGPAVSGAMRYLLATLLGSLSYLLGVALLYHAYGTVDIALLAARVDSTPVTWAALGLMVTGLLLKTALFPLHFWLPPAHASAPAPVSALLSALVVKASFYILLRLWLAIFSPMGGHVADLLGLLGMAAILWGSVQALRQPRLKLLIAYSTVAQLGYLFLAFPRARTGISVWRAALYLLLSHALAKAAMFMTAGNLLRFGHHDRIADLDRVVQRVPITAGAFALAGVSIMGLPPSGGFIGKWLLLEAALSQGRWDIVGIILVGGLLAAAYVFKVMGHAFTQAGVTHEAHRVPRTMEWTALSLAFAAILLGFVAVPLLHLINTGAVAVGFEVSG